MEWLRPAKFADVVSVVESTFLWKKSPLLATSLNGFVEISTQKKPWNDLPAQFKVIPSPAVDPLIHCAGGVGAGIPLKPVITG